MPGTASATFPLLRGVTPGASRRKPSFTVPLVFLRGDGVIQKRLAMIQIKDVPGLHLRAASRTVVNWRVRGLRQDRRVGRPTTGGGGGPEPTGGD
jgi:hypothetical protein